MLRASDLRYTDVPQKRVLWYSDIEYHPVEKRVPNRMLVWYALLLAFLGGCATQNNMQMDRKVKGLNGLRTTAHIVQQGEIWDRCGKDKFRSGWLVRPLACAEIDFDQWTCDYYITENSTAATIEHERLHCRGWDHGGQLQRAYDAWKAAQIIREVQR